MKDRFRFRAWNKKTKKMHYDAEQTYDFMEGRLTICEESFGQLLEYKDYIVMQSTGLKDINGKSIYEGDIIVIPNLYPFYDYANKQDMTQNLNETEGIIKGKSVLNYIGIVEWIYSSWQYVYHCVNPQKQGISEGMNNLLNEIGYEEGEITKYEVIGNIYENKDLLEEQK